MAIHVGIDLGSLSLKAALVSSDPADAPFFDRLAANPIFQSVRRLTAPDGRVSRAAVTRYARIAGGPAREARSLLERLIAIIDGNRLGAVHGERAHERLLGLRKLLCQRFPRVDESLELREELPHQRLPLPAKEIGSLACKPDLGPA